MEDFTTSQKDRADRILGAAGAFHEAQILLAANRTGLFQALGRETRTAGDIAARVKLPLRGVSAVLDALTAMGVVSKEGDRYRNGPEAEEFLLEDSETRLTELLLHNERQFRKFAGLSEALKRGGPKPREDRYKDPARHREFILAMANLGSFSAETLAPLLNLRGTERILDLGGGPGTYMQVICRAYPGIQATVFDLPRTAPVAEEYLSAFPERDRITFQEGDFLTDDPRGEFDAVLLSNIIHMLGPQDILKLFERAARVLAPGGRIFVKDFFLEDSRTSPRGAAVFVVNMFLSTEQGGCFTFSEVEEWLAVAGFEAFRRASLTRDSSLIEAVHHG